MGSLFDKGSTETESKNKIPSWLESGSKKAVGIGKDIADRKYQAYGGDRVANATNNEQAGYLSANGFRGSYQPYLNQSAGALGMADQRFTDADMGGYMNPYIESALDPAARQMGESFEAQRNNRNMNASASGAFGGLRNEIGNNMAEDNYLSSIGDMYSQGMAGGYDRATQLWGQDRSQQQDIARQYQSLGQTAAGLRGNEVNMLLGAGQSERGIGQAQADTDYADYLEKRDWKISNMQPLLSAVGSVPHSTTRTGTTQEKMGLGGMVAQGAGTAAMAYGASSKDYKTAKRPVEGSVLNSIASMPVESWEYKGDDSQRFIGPYAEDYAERFGGDGKRISPGEATGVQWAGLNEAAQRIKKLEEKVNA